MLCLSGFELCSGWVPLRCDAERNQKNSHFRKTLNCSQNFRENNSEALLIFQRLKLP